MDRATSSFHRHAAVATAWLAIAVPATGCEQPKPKCTSAHGSFAATFTLVSGEGVCAELTTSVLNVQSYNDSKSDGTLDPDRPTLAIQTQEATDALASGRETDADAKPFAFGAFDRSEPDGDGICTVSTLSEAVLRAPATEEVPEMMIDECTLQPAQPAQPTIDARYEWKNVRIVVTPSAIGTKLEADLEYTVEGCTAEYKVTAVWPIVECGSPVQSGEEEPPAETPPASEDDAGAPPENPDCPMEEPEPPPPELEADDDICKTQEAIPDFPVRCDATTLMCVLED